jgi:hypothetical protein
MVEVRGSSASIKEFSQYKNEFLSIFSGKLLQVKAMKAPLTTASHESTASSVTTPTANRNNGSQSFGLSSQMSFGSTYNTNTGSHGGFGDFGNVDLSTPKLSGSNTLGDFDFGPQISSTTTTEEIRAPSRSFFN